MKRKKWITVILVILSLTACRGKDSAVIIPIGEEITSDTEHRDEEMAENADIDVSEDVTGTIFVYVCGAVNNPGVVELPAGSRADDALQAAGGLAENACEDYVNLAARISDGEKLYFPDREEAQAWEQEQRAKASGLVNINTAGQELLMTLPGIGESRANDIIDYREKNGLFQTIRDIQNVPGIKESIYEKIQDRIEVQ